MAVTFMLEWVPSLSRQWAAKCHSFSSTAGLSGKSCLSEAQRSVASRALTARSHTFKVGMFYNGEKQSVFFSMIIFILDGKIQEWFG